MGISLNGLTPAGTYPGLIKTGDNTAISGTPKVLSDGNGNNLPIEVSTAGVNFTNNLTQGGTALQPVLVSGTNIKTINGASLLGSGNIPVVTSPSGVSGAIQFSNGSAFASDATNLFWDDTNNRLGVGTNSPTALTHIVGNWQSPSLVRQWFKLTETSTGNTFGIVPSQVGLSNVGYTFQINEGNEIVGRVGQTLFGTGLTGGEMTARVGIRGNGSTSATTSLLVQNSSSVNSLQLKDNGDLATYGSINIRSQAGDNGGNIFTGATENLSLSSSAYGTGSSVNINTNGVIIQRLPTNANAAASAVLDIRSTTQGFLPPRMTTTQKNAIASPAAGLVVYDSTTNKLCCYNGSTWNDLF